MAATAPALSSSSLRLKCAKPSSLNNRVRTFKLGASASRSAVMASTATKVIPSIIVGGGRVGKALQDMGNGDDVLIKRGESVPLDFPGPIFVCTRNDDLEAVLESTPKSRWSGMILN